MKGGGSGGDATGGRPARGERLGEGRRGGGALGRSDGPVLVRGANLVPPAVRRTLVATIGVTLPPFGSIARSEHKTKRLDFGETA